MTQVMDMNEVGAKTEDHRPSRGFTTKKTVGTGMLNTALMVADAAQIKTLFGLRESDRDGFWYAEIVLLFISIVLQVTVAVLLTVQGFRTPKTEAERKKSERMNNIEVILVLFITIVNVFVSAFGIEISSSAT